MQGMNISIAFGGKWGRRVMEIGSEMSIKGGFSLYTTIYRSLHYYITLLRMNG